jgi:dihydroorotate dehydrogenase electron transfer subunit
MKKSVQNLLVVSNQKLNRDHVLLELKSDLPLIGITAGQFANILVDKTSNVFLRRPFSIFQVDYNCNTIFVLIKAIGEGTKCLANSKVGERLSVIFPLGRGYTVPKKKSRVLMVGGGVGIAPLMLLSANLRKDAHHIEILIGAKSAGDLVLLDAFSQYGTVHTTTEDGSQGSKGFVTDHSLLKQDIQLFDMIYTCGPEPMMKAVAKIAYLNDIDCEVSLENTMACGYGVCLCCVTETTQGHRCVCTDGPVFDIKQLKWQN